MKERLDDREMGWERGWFFGERRRLGFGFWLGLFLLVWGIFELAREFGWIKMASFPFWPLLLIVVGLSMLLHRIL